MQHGTESQGISWGGLKNNENHEKWRKHGRVAISEKAVCRKYFTPSE